MSWVVLQWGLSIPSEEYALDEYLAHRKAQKNS